jgi:hypothetical protein
MPKLGFSDGLALVGLALTLVLIVLDKAGKLKGPILLILLALAAAMVLPVALGTSWVSDAESGMLKFSRGLFVVFIIGVVYSGLAVWISGDETPRENASLSKERDGSAELKFKHAALGFFVPSGSAFIKDRAVQLRAVYENTSDNTAKRVSANGVLCFIASGQGMREREEEEWRKFRASWLTSLQGTLKEELEGHKEKSFDVETDPLSLEEEQDLRSGTKLAYFMAAIKWTDSTGEYETNICRYFSPNERGTTDAPAVWHDCLSGHNVTRRPFQLADIVPSFTQRANVQIVRIVFPSREPNLDPHWQPGKPILITVHVVNNGLIPAERYAPSFRIAISSKATEREDQERIWSAVKTQLDTMRYGDNSLLPGRDAIITVQYPSPLYHELPLTEDDIRQIKTGTKQLILAGAYKYIDEFGPRETHICQSYIGESWRYWTDCYGHNELIP